MKKVKLIGFWKRVSASIFTDQEKKVLNSQALPEVALAISEAFGWFSIIFQVWMKSLPSKKKMSTGTVSPHSIYFDPKGKRFKKCPQNDTQ